MLAPEFLAVENLADQRFAAGDVAVGFDPGRADRLPAAVGDPFADLAEQVGEILAQEVVDLRLALHETVVGKLVDVAQRRRRRASHLLPRFVERPEPGHVDVGVANHVDVDRFRRVSRRAQRFDLFGQDASGRRGVDGALPAVEVNRVDRVDERLPEPDRGAVVLGQRARDTEHRAQFVLQRIDIFVEANELGVHRLALAVPGREQHDVDAVGGVRLAVRIQAHQRPVLVQALPGPAVQVEHRFGIVRHPQVDGRCRQLGRDLDVRGQPVGLRFLARRAERHLERLGGAGRFAGSDVVHLEQTGHGLRPGDAVRPVPRNRPSAGALTIAEAVVIQLGDAALYADVNDARFDLHDDGFSCLEA